MTVTVTEGHVQTQTQVQSTESRRVEAARLRLDKLKEKRPTEGVDDGLERRIALAQADYELQLSRPARTSELIPPMGPAVFKLKMDLHTEIALEYLLSGVDSRQLGQPDSRRLTKAEVFRLSVRLLAEQYGLDFDEVDDPQPDR